MARRARSTPTDDAQMSLDLLWGADDSTDVGEGRSEHAGKHHAGEHQADESNDRTEHNEQQVIGTPVAGTQTGETDEKPCVNPSVVDLG